MVLCRLKREEERCDLKRGTLAEGRRGDLALASSSSERSGAFTVWEEAVHPRLCRGAMQQVFPAFEVGWDLYELQA